jgi:hypothetical protein
MIMRDALVLLDANSAITSSFVEVGAQRVRTSEEISESYRTAEAGTRWVSEGDMLDRLTRALQRLLPSEPEQALLVLDKPEHMLHARRQFLSAFFHTLVFAKPSGRFLPPDEIAEVMASANAGDYAIGAEIDEHDDVMLLYLGTLERVPVPLDFFRPSGTGKKPEFGKFSVIDSGQTLKFGDYEATVDAVLYDRDPAYRKRAKANRIRQDNTFGGAFKRLRLLRGLTQSSFKGVTEREIRRIERNEVEPGNLRSDTRRTIERALRVSVDKIREY